MAKLDDLFGPVNQKLKDINSIMIGVIFVLLIGFISVIVSVMSLVINADGEKHGSYQDLRDQVQTQNAKIDALTKALTDQQKTQIPATPAR